MTTYQQRKEKARETAIEWQMETADKPLSYGELAEAQNKLEALARRYGLMKECHENGII